MPPSFTHTPVHACTIGHLWKYIVQLFVTQLTAFLSPFTCTKALITSDPKENSGCLKPVTLDSQMGDLSPFRLLKAFQELWESEDREGTEMLMLLMIIPGGRSSSLFTFRHLLRVVSSCKKTRQGDKYKNVVYLKTNKSQNKKTQTIYSYV